MFKMKKILLVGGALLLLAGCSKPAEPEFEQNEDPIVEGFTMYIIGSHWNNWDTKTIKEARSMIHPQYASRFIREYLIDEKELSEWHWNVSVREVVETATS